MQDGFIATLRQEVDPQIQHSRFERFLFMQADSEQRPHKVSYRVSLKGQQAKECIEHLKERLATAGLSTKVIYSGGEDLDVLPAKASKGKGLEFLLKEVQNPTSIFLGEWFPNGSF